MAGWHSGCAEVCKTSNVGSIPTPALHLYGEIR